MGLKDGERSPDKPLLALIIGQLLNKTSSASGGDTGSNFRSQAIAKENGSGAQATEEAVAPQGTNDQEQPQTETIPSKSQKSLQLKSSKSQPQETPSESHKTKQPDQSEENDFIDYDDDFGDEFEDPTDEGIKVSSSDIEPVNI